MDDWIRLLRPKNWPKFWPALLDGVVGSSVIATPSLALAAERVSCPLVKLALPSPPSVLLRVLRKFAGVKLTVEVTPLLSVSVI